MAFSLKKVDLFNHSIKTRVVVLISALITSAMILITFMVVYIVQVNMSEQIGTMLENRAHSIHERLEQRIGNLVENTLLLTKNELMVNALTDANGRKIYLPQLVENFMEGKDVISLNIVDFDGRAIFQTQGKIPIYNESSELRSALALGEMTYYMQENNKLVIVSPIEYYNTTQGAAVVVFDMVKVAGRTLPEDENIYMKLSKNKYTVFLYNFNKDIEYKSYLHPIPSDLDFFKHLGISLEIGVPLEIYTAPVKDVIVQLTIAGIFFILVGIYLAFILANSITTPILKLYNRVKFSSTENEMSCSPLGTNDELEELAKAFDERSLMLQEQAQHDALTKLPNRILFIDRLKQSITNAPRNKENLAVLFIDLDHFKEINDSFGHDFGDKLLVRVGKYLGSVLRESDTVARIGGDEFTILLNNLTNENSIVPILEKIMSLFKEPFIINKSQFYITCSIGVSVYPFDGHTPDTLLKNADAAMYKAKDSGRHTYEFYTKDMTQKAYDRITLETQIRQAIENKEFEVYYQPQVNMNSGKIIGMEALVRWNHPKDGLVSPAKFIPLAEETGLIIDIDRQVMQDAINQFKKWVEDGFDVGVLSLNLSIMQLNHEGFIVFLKNLISESKISVENLMLEITETQIMKNPEESIIKLQELQDIGIRLAIDDFGTGHSSLSYIKKLPIDKLKIDQSFTKGVLVGKDDAELTKAIISIAKNLNLEIIAEGVETEEQAAFLLQNGCDEAQGYLYFRPKDAKSISKILAARGSY